MRKLILSVFLSAWFVALAVLPVLADSIGPTPK
jgi:hypothetical protein